MKDYVLLVTSSSIGKGEEKLGQKLMAAYFHALNEGHDLPTHILLLHEGVKLAVEQTPLLANLQNLEEKGVKILACGTCLDYYGIKDKLQVGLVGNMFGTRDLLAQGEKVIQLS